ncbi:MAG: hypothetical protein ACFFB3_10840, partial [Candidatus Hodarchaeota archaeon]
MSSLLGEELVISVALIAWLFFLIFTIIMLAYMVLESWGSLWDLLWRALVLVAIIPPGVFLLSISLFFLVSPFFYNLAEEQQLLILIIYALFVLLASMLGQFIYVRNTALDGMRQHQMSFLEYVQYLMHRGVERKSEEAQKLDVRLRADTLFDKIEDIRPAAMKSVAVSQEIPSRLARVPKIDVHGRLPAFNIRWRWILPIAAIESILFFLLLWVVPILFLIAGYELDILAEQPGLGASFVEWLNVFLWLLFLPFLGTLIFLFFVGALTDIRMSETPILILAPSVLSLPPFFYSIHFILGFQTLRDITLLTLLSIVIFMLSAVPILFFLAIFIGSGVGDWLLTGTTLQRFSSRGLTLSLVVACVLTIISIFGLNEWLFPSEMDKGMIVLECTLAVAIFLGLAKIPLDEKLLVSLVAPLLAIAIGLFLGSPIHLMMWLLVPLPLVTYFADTLDLNITKIHLSRAIISILLLLFLSEIWYLLVYYAISDQSFVIVLLAIAGTAIFLGIKLHLEPEEGLIISPIVTIGFVAMLLIDNLLPRYENLDDILLGNLPGLFLILIAFSILLGQIIRQNVLFIADDGHKLSNKGER